MRKFSGSETQSHVLPKVAHANGCYITVSSGKQTIDGSAGPAVFSLEHAYLVDDVTKVS